MRRACSVALFIVAVATPLTASAQPRMEPPLEHWREELGLTDEQIVKIGDIQYASRVDEIGRRAELERAELELEREMRKAMPEESTALRLFDAAHKARGELERIHLRTRLRVRAILTPEQDRELHTLAGKAGTPRKDDMEGRPPRPSSRTRR
ncbi:Spy/CpxP family protein refolding chaperone [Candidatus Fermentibacteria bacterium]|nr:Spy/CpxP family protein refolding chaperone [Candidatus Fermentibacteria bacterium]